MLFVTSMKELYSKMKHIIIMGATSGIGMEVAKIFIADGWTVGIAGRRLEQLSNLKSLAKDRVHIKQIDINDSTAAEKFNELIDECNGIDIYLHSSGIGYNNPTLDSAPELQTVETNAMGFTRMIDAAFNYFAGKGGGHIAAITSIAGTKGLGAAPAYSATKRFQSTYLSALSQQATMRKTNIKVTDIKPGFVQTDLLKGREYPMMMDAKHAARMIFNAIIAQRRTRIIDWRYRILVFFWRLIPRPLWERWGINA